ncbi:MAG: SDR family oxidoreductase, partial [Pseudomonadales bacterium]|nr:SDR family oxidoreductase [Pseudomonadales bacterium]
IESGGGKASALRVDVSKAADVEAMISACVDRFGGIDILVNNAGYSHLSMLMWKLPEEDFDGVFDVNVKGVFLGCKFAIPHMIERGGGAIVNTASIGAVAPRPGVTAYNATKGAVLTMTKGLALEVARHKIRVNCVNPVAADTGFMKGAMGVDKLNDEQTANLTGTIPLRRLSTPEDVAAAVCFLASDEAGMITGTALNVDGGRSI